VSDIYGTEARVGDVIVTTSGTRGLVIGKVYAFDKNGYPLIKVAVKDYRKLLYVWKKQTAGGWYIVLNKPTGAWLTPPVNTRLELDYDADEPSFLG
jgi:ketosteroid isomerase-like protein